MNELPRKALAEHRRRQKRKGLVRVEVLVPKEDAALVRRVAKALSNPDRLEAARTRANLAAPFAGQAKGLKELLASMPPGLEDADLERNKDTGAHREIDWSDI